MPLVRTCFQDMQVCTCPSNDVHMHATQTQTYNDGYTQACTHPHPLGACQPYVYFNYYGVHFVSRFAFSADPASCTRDQEARGLWHDSDGVFLFTIVSAKPQYKVLHGPSCIGSDALVISKVEVAQASPKMRKVRAYLEQVDGSADGTLLIFTPGSLSVDDFSTLRLWDVSPTMHYSFSGQRAMPDVFEEHLQSVVQGLLRARSKADDAGYEISSNVGQSNLETLQYLERLGFVDHPEGQRQLWRLTSQGQSKLQVTRVLDNSKLALRPEDCR